MLKSKGLAGRQNCSICRYCARVSASSRSVTDCLRELDKIDRINWAKALSSVRAALVSPDYERLYAVERVKNKMRVHLELQGLLFELEHTVLHLQFFALFSSVLRTCRIRLLTPKKTRPNRAIPAVSKNQPVCQNGFLVENEAVMGSAQGPVGRNSLCPKLVIACLKPGKVDRLLGRKRRPLGIRRAFQFPAVQKSFGIGRINGLEFKTQVVFVPGEAKALAQATRRIQPIRIALQGVCKTTQFDENEGGAQSDSTGVVSECILSNRSWCQTKGCPPGRKQRHPDRFQCLRSLRFFHNAGFL